MKKRKLTLCALTLVIALVACFTVLEAPKAFAATGQTDSFSDSVEDPAYANTYTTTWKSHHNCYAFALGRVYLSYKDTSHEDSFCEIGGYCGNIINHATATTQQRISRMRQDFAALKYTDVTVSTTLPTDLADDYTLICYREGTAHDGGFDYHFMRYNSETGKWHHKPGTLGKALIYQYTPSNDRVWTHSYVDAGKTYTVTYDEPIYYISYKETIGFNQTLGANVIKTADHFAEMRTRTDENWCLGNDVSLYSFTAWDPIENFSGIFSGNGYAITDLRYRGAAKSKIGLFGTLTGAVNGVTIRSAEVNVIGAADLTQTINIGAIAAINEGSITKCTVGASRTYANAVLNSSTMANIGGIAGLNRGGIINCEVNFFTSVATGNIGGIVGFMPEANNTTEEDSPEENPPEGAIQSCKVKNAELHVYSGCVGGIVGYNQGTYVLNCTVSDSNISCYNGFPSTSSSYYPSSHYGYAGGIAGWYSSEGLADIFISGCSIVRVNLASNNESVDSSHGGRSFAPEIGLICGRARADKIQSCTFDSASTVTGNNLHTETWGIWPFNHSWNQAQYVGTRAVGHSL